ncbi:hypothetical protein K457DRAFT_19624 [Linnemannia elongata AG-77]|uniref:Uncharacterized protein n=1 Tax=Linnemannia elongata AG-77 TaxID=1314771 RepID=A0A197JWY0_9FUNG|nr:hypothetical protein K457DRAFT_19624 [Linnemannia elongata AG-77]
MANSRRVPNVTFKAGILLQKSQYALSFNDYEKLLLQMSTSMSGAISCTYSLQELAPRNMDDLWERVQDIWATLQEDYLHDVYQSLPRRMREVVRN